MSKKLEADVLFLNSEYEAAADKYLDGAREGDRLSAFNYGYCLWKGLGRAYNPKEAKSYFAFARDLDGGEACYNLAMMYMHGEGVSRDYKKALQYMTISAEQGAIEAQLYLGMAYTLGCMFEPDIVGISLIPFHKPEYRREDSFLLSGNTYDEREEDERFSVISADAREAFLWFQTAARHDPTYVSELVAKGKYLYAKCYIDGLGTDFDRMRGARIMLLAGKEGSSEAIAFLKENGIDPNQLLSDGRTKKKYR